MLSLHDTNAVLLYKGILSNPPAMAAAIGIARMGATVTIIVDDCHDSVKDILSEHGVHVRTLNPGFRSSRNATGKLLQWISFRLKALKTLSKYPVNSLIWIGSADTALALTGGVRCTYVLQVNELYDRFPLYRFLLKYWFSRAVEIVVPDATRAAIFRVWYRLSCTPTLLPNKPLYHPRNRNRLVTSKLAASALDRIPQDRKIILYQGHVHPERDLRALADAVQVLNEHWHLAVMGPLHGTYLDELKSRCSNMTYIPFVPAPLHLEVTSRAHVGVVMYSYDSLNTIFCAPNKVWEFAGFGIPLLAQSLPSLESSVGKYEAGVCVDTLSSDAIIAGLGKIDRDYDYYSANSNNYFNMCDIQEIVSGIAARAMDRSVANQ